MSFGIPRGASVVEVGFSLLAWVAIACFTIVWFAWMALWYAMHPWVDPHRHRLHRMGCIWGRILVALAPWARMELRGLEHVPKGRPVIFMANHQSYVDVAALSVLPFSFRWMADADLFRIPVLGWGMRLIGHIPVRRGDASLSLYALKCAEGYLKEGISIILFPEGTRSRTGVLGRFRTGGFRLAIKTQTPIVPVVVAGTRLLLPRGSWVFRWGARIRIWILPPIAPSANAKEIRGLMRHVRAQLWHGYRDALRGLHRHALKD